MRVASIDLGSNSFQLLVAEVIGCGSFEAVLREERMIQLGKTALVTGRLDPQFMMWGLRGLDQLRRIALARGVERLIAVATSAIREAENGEEFLRRAREDYGMPVGIVSGREEMRLIHLAVSRNADFGSEKALLIDIGGGSVKLAVADAAKIYYSVSRKLGFLRLHGRFVDSDPASRREVRILTAFLRDSLANPLAAVRKHAPGRVIVTGGAMTALPRLVQQCRRLLPSESAASGYISRDEARQTLATLAAVPLVERIRQFGLDPSRAQYLPTALRSLMVILDGLGAGGIVVSPVALNEGLIYHVLAHAQPQPFSAKAEGDLRLQAVLDLAHHCNYPIDHSHSVARLAGQIFAQTASLHALGEAEARLLEFASILHDIGHYIGHARHHRHADDLVMNCELRGLVPEERAVVAKLVRYHRRAAPRASHKAFARLSSRSQLVVRYLAAILRIAEALDRTHFSLVDSVRCTIGRGRVRFELTVHRIAPNLQVDLQTVRRRARYFEKVFGVAASFVVRRAAFSKDSQQGG